MTEENEKRVHAFYKAIAPGHRESLCGASKCYTSYTICLKECPLMRAF